jgi:hypothetical protein
MITEVATCRAGVARVCITPDLPCEMAGYFHSRVAESVARDLYATALVLENQGQHLVILSCDLIAMTDELCLPAFEQAGRQHGIPLSHCLACATHTHTGPEIRHGATIPCCDDYVRKVAPLLTQAVMRAFDSRFDAVLCLGATRAPGLAHNRLSRCADGSEVFGRQNVSARVIGAAGPEDDTVQTLSVYDTAKRLRAVAVNFACHPDLSGGGGAKAIHADWPGEMAEYLMRVHGPDLACMLWQGTAGDINHADHRATVPRWLPGGCSTVARGVAGAALYALETATPLGDLAVSARRRELEIPYYVRDAKLLELAQVLKAKGEAATYFEKNLAKKIETWPNDGKTDRVGVSCLRLGDLAIVGLPGEIFTAWGLEIKRYSPARHTFVIELAGSHDGLTGYKATSDQSLRGARGKGAYGALPTLSQKHCPASGQMIAEAAIEMLYELWPEGAVGPGQ